MKKWLFCILVLAAVPVLSYGGFGGEDVGELSPVQVVMLRSDREGVRLLTDTEAVGVGPNPRKAVENMEETTEKRVFLDTADYLLLEPGTEHWLPQLVQYLRPSCNLCYVGGELKLERAGEYLQLHQPKLTLTQYEAGKRRLAYLISDEGRLKLVQP